MSRRPRTPPNWPRMKVRGRLRKRLVDARITIRHVLTAKIEREDLSADGSGFRYRMTACPEGTPGARRVEYVVTTDGYGRPVKTWRS